MLIDFPLSPIKEFQTNGYGLTIDEVLEYHSNLAKFAESKGLRLVVKLHPYQFPIQEFVSTDSITYVREGDVVMLLKQASLIYGFSSTLMLPAIYAKPVGIFTFLQHSDFIEGLSKRAW